MTLGYQIKPRVSSRRRDWSGLVMWYIKTMSAILSTIYKRMILPLGDSNNNYQSVEWLNKPICKTNPYINLSFGVKTPMYTVTYQMSLKVLNFSVL